VQAGFKERCSCRNATSNPFLERTIRPQSYQRGLWILAIPLFQWSLKGSKLISIHIDLLLLLRTATIVCSKFFLNSFLFEQGLAIAKRLAEQDKSNFDWQRGLIVSIYNVGTAMAKIGGNNNLRCCGHAQTTAQTSRIAGSLFAALIPGDRHHEFSGK